MLRKMLTLGALIVVAVTFGVGNAAAKSDKPNKASKADHGMSADGFSDGRMSRDSGCDGFSDGRG